MAGEGGGDEKLEWLKTSLTIIAPFIVAVVITGKDEVKTTEGSIAAITLLFAVAFLLSGAVLRGISETTSTPCVIAGGALLLASIHSLICYSLPSYLKWMTPLCWLPLLITLVWLAWAYCCGEKKNSKSGGGAPASHASGKEMEMSVTKGQSGHQNMNDNLSEGLVVQNSPIIGNHVHTQIDEDQVAVTVDEAPSD